MLCDKTYVRAAEGCRRRSVACRRVAALIAAFALSACGSGDSPDASVSALRLADYYGDHMLFQRDAPMPLSGWSLPGARVVASDDRATVQTTADAAGHWRLQLPAHAATPSVTLQVESSGHRLLLRDVAVGELWFAAGQSNMAWPMAWIEGRGADIAAARDPRLRLLSVAPAAWQEPRADAAGTWHATTPQTVRDFSALAYHFGRHLRDALDVPVGLIHAGWGGSRIEPWLPAEAYAELVPSNAHLAENPHNRSHAPAALYNAMVHPFTTLPVRGVIWYQGEANLADGPHYGPKLEALIEGWREAWASPSLPFLFAQIAPLDYTPYAPNPPPDLLQRFWETQIDMLRVPGTGLVSTLDLNPDRELHPGEKREAGERFAALALQQVYGIGAEAQSPRYRRHRVDGAQVRVEWLHAQGLRSPDGGPPQGFELAGADGVFHPAQARIDGDAVMLTSERVPQPQRVRYAWQATPAVGLVNGAGLPALPFRAPR